MKKHPARVLLLILTPIIILLILVVMFHFPLELGILSVYAFAIIFITILFCVHAMKKGMYINISIITASCLGLSLFNESSYGTISGLVMTVYIIAACRLSYIFTSREDNITPKRRVIIIVFIILNYLAILGLGYTRYYNLPITDFVTGGILVLYIILIMIYFESIFDKHQKTKLI